MSVSCPKRNPHHLAASSHGQGAPFHVLETTCCSPAYFSLDLAKHLVLVWIPPEPLLKSAALLNEGLKRPSYKQWPEMLIYLPLWLRDAQTSPWWGEQVLRSNCSLGKQTLTRGVSPACVTCAHIHGKLTPSQAVFPHFRLHQPRIHLPPWKLIAIIKQKELAKRSLRWKAAISARKKIKTI